MARRNKSKDISCVGDANETIADVDKMDIADSDANSIETQALKDRLVESEKRAQLLETRLARLELDRPDNSARERGLYDPVINVIDAQNYREPQFEHGNVDFPYARPRNLSHRERGAAELQRRREDTIPRPKMVTFDGKEDWVNFEIPFKRIASRAGWPDGECLEQLYQCLRGDAMTFVSGLTSAIQNDYTMMMASLKRRFGDRALPETYRAQLHTLRQNPKESTAEFAAKIRAFVVKAYPAAPEELQEKLAVEHFLKGLPDTQTGYDVMVKQPRDLNEAEHMVAVHESFKTNFNRKSVRAVSSVSEEQEPIAEVRRMSDKRLVTEERLQVFGHELKRTITTEVTDKVTAAIAPELKEIKSMLNPGDNIRQAGGQRRTYNRQKVTCHHGCGKVGHIKRFCPEGKTSNQHERPPANPPSDSHEGN